MVKRKEETMRKPEDFIEVVNVKLDVFERFERFWTRLIEIRSKVSHRSE